LDRRLGGLQSMMEWFPVPVEDWTPLFWLVSSHCSVRGCIQKFPDWVDNEINNKINTRWEATQRVMATKLTGLTHKIAIQLHLVAETCTICISRSRRWVRKFWIHTRTVTFHFYEHIHKQFMC
jgi:hypothetical protein